MSDKKSNKTARLGRFASPDSVVLERLLPGPIDLVWRYLTDADRLSEWLAGGIVNPCRGGTIDLNFDLIQCPGRENMHGTMSGVITIFDPPHLLSYSWNEDARLADPNSNSVVSFELESAGENETKLTLTHTRIRRLQLSGIAAGWHVHLDVLEHRLSKTKPGHFEKVFNELEPQYKKLL